MKESVKRLIGGLIVSCQAYEDTPLYGSDNMRRMAECAIMGGANGLRSCWPQDIGAIRAITDLPIIGINKQFGDGDPLDNIFITPTFESAEVIIAAGADIVAVDCTIRPCRSFDLLYALLEKLHTHYPDIAIMADLATPEEAVKAAETGFVDIISSTLAGYTRQSLRYRTDGPCLEVIREMREKITLPINGEGRVWDLRDLETMLETGVDMVTVGTAITRPHLIAQRFVNFNNRYHHR